MFTVTWINFAAAKEDIGCKIAYEGEEACKLVNKKARDMLMGSNDVVRDFKEWLATLGDEDSNWAYKEMGDHGDDDDEDYEEDPYLVKGLFCSFHFVGT